MTQLRLPVSKAFNPLPAIDSYVAALQSKPGERRALLNLPAEAWNRFTPLLSLVGPRHRGKELTAATVREWVKRLADVVNGHPILVDLLRLAPLKPTMRGRRTEPFLRVLYEQCRKRGVQFIPVVSTHASERHVALLREEIVRDQRGVCIRYPILEEIPPPGASPSEHLVRIAESLDVPAEEIDLVFDLGFLGAESLVSGEDLQPLIEEITATAGWRNLILLGSSMPRTLASVKEGSIQGLPRQEWHTWRGLSSSDLGRTLTYGDYAIQHPDPPEEGAGPGMRPNIRYTAGDETLVIRGIGPAYERGHWKYRELCDELVALPQFAGSGYSWGDHIIDYCARGLTNPGNQNMWRGVGTSHHIQVVLDQLAA